MIFFSVAVQFPWGHWNLSRSDAQIKFSLWKDESFRERLWDMDWIHTFAGLEKWTGPEF
jgi:hypothetical protein